MQEHTVWLCVLPLAASTTVAAAADMPTGKAYVNSLGICMVRIEPGSFLMGSAKGGHFDERPVHRVRITRPFYMAATEVTNAQYERFAPEHRRLRGKWGYSTQDEKAVVFVSWPPHHEQEPLRLQPGVADCSGTSINSI